MLTSKEIIERTGISRATLNNYIASGLVPRPQVLAPGPADSAAPRIGYFPDDTLERIGTIQRLKREGWSIARIAQQLAGDAPAAAPRMAAPVAPALPAPTPAPAMPQAQPPRREARPALRASGQAAYLVDDAFQVGWVNDAQAAAPLVRAKADGSIFAQLLALPADAARDALLRFHLQVARDRDVPLDSLLPAVDGPQAEQLEAVWSGLAGRDPGLVDHALVPAAGSRASHHVYAVHFRESVLFAYAPAPAPDPAPVAAPARRVAPAAPVVTPVAVLAGSLNDAAGLWVRLTAQEYFELLNEVWAELDRIFSASRGRPGRHAGEVVVCYFLPQAQGSYLWNALAAAHQTREAMRQVSQRWQVRKGWDVELSINLGLDEGQDWLGAVGAADRAELRVLGDAADRAEQLARCSRLGAILVTRNLLGKLDAADRQRMTYGVPRLEAGRGDAPLLFTFARLEEIAAPARVPPRVADVAVAELLDLNTTHNPPAPRAAG